MNIDYSLKDKNGPVLLVRYDAEAQSAFVKAHAVAEEIWQDGQIQHICARYGQVFLVRLRAGLDGLRLLAENTTGTIEIADYDLQAIFEVTVITSEAGVAIEKNVSVFSEVIVLLAKIATLITPLFPLPPAAEVFDRDKVSAEVWNGFESIRYKAGVDSARLAFLQLYHLWFTLAQMRPTNGELRCLLQYLDQVTGMFRGAMGSHAASTVALAKPTKKNRQRRKS